MPRSVRLNRSVWPFPCRWYAVVLGFSIPATLHKSLMILDSKSHLWSECNRWGNLKSTRIFSNNNLATVEACWLRVGNAQEYFMKLSVTTSTCLKQPFPFSNDRKLMANSSIGSLARIGTMGALGWSGDLLLMHLSQLAMCLSTSFSTPGQQNQWRMRSTVLSWPRWPSSLWKPCSTWGFSEFGSTNWRFSLFSTVHRLYNTPPFSTKRLLSLNIQTNSGLSDLSWPSDWVQWRMLRTQPTTGSFCWRLDQSTGRLFPELPSVVHCMRWHADCFYLGERDVVGIEWLQHLVVLTNSLKGLTWTDMECLLCRRQPIQKGLDIIFIWNSSSTRAQGVWHKWAFPASLVNNWEIKWC